MYKQWWCFRLFSSKTTKIILPELLKKRVFFFNVFFFFFLCQMGTIISRFYRGWSEKEKNTRERQFIAKNVLLVSDIGEEDCFRQLQANRKATLSQITSCSVCRTVSLNVKHVEPWSRWATLAGVTNAGCYKHKPEATFYAGWKPKVVKPDTAQYQTQCT